MNAIKNMLRHPNVYGAGAAKRRASKDPAKDKMSVVMKEFKRGTLHSGGSKKIVTNKRQALAIGFSEQRRAKRGK